MRKTFELHFEIENNCFLNCMHCSSIGIKNKKKLGYNINQINSLIRLFEEELTIYLTGGEPLLNRNLKSIIKSIKQEKPDSKLGLFTSGIICRENAEYSISLKEANEYKEIGLSSCYISIYSNDYRIHDFITNTIDSLKYTEESIRNLLMAGIEVKIHLVINKYNINNLEQVIRNLIEKGVSEIRILKIVKHGMALNNWEAIGVSEMQQVEAISNIYKNRYNYPIKITFAGFPEMIACRPFESAIKCQGGTNLLYITFDGFIFPCACTRSKEKFKIGSINELGSIENYLKAINKNFNKHCLNKLK